MRLPLRDLGHIEETYLHEPRLGPTGAITTDFNTYLQADAAKHNTFV